MLQVHTSQQKPRVTAGQASAAEAAPPVISPAREEHSIFGALSNIEGFALERQHMSMLNHWHQKAIAATDEYWASEPENKPDNDPEHDVLFKAKWDIFHAAFEARISSVVDLASLLQIVMRQTRDSGESEFLDTEQLQIIADAAAAIARSPQPTKRVGNLNRGSKLTRAGLLHRYHAFLIGELKTLSWNLYGSHDYALSMTPMDHEVIRRTKEDFRNGKPLPYRSGRKQYPFFDESKLTARARSVLKSLKIDTEKVDR
jgi:hypothetical protein